MLRVRSSEQGFSLIELLTVIAIIAILAAMIFPAMTAVKQRANQTKCMSNMMNIAKAVKMYKLDNRKFPDSLAIRDAALTGTFDQYMTMPKPGVLMGDYSMKTAEVFRCPGSKTTDYNAIVPQALNPLLKGPATMDGKSDGPVAQYFKVDDYDVALENGVWIQKYVTEWATKNTATPDPNDPASGGAYDFANLKRDPITDGMDPAQVDEQDYKRQLIWRDPPDDTVLTWCSNHGGTKDVVLFLGGTAKTISHDTVVGSRWRTRIPRQ
jgi:prepilin-type N-terminal cleavage/methylation domain-containing protein